MAAVYGLVPAYVDSRASSQPEEPPPPALTPRTSPRRLGQRLAETNRKAAVEGIGPLL